MDADQYYARSIRIAMNKLWVIILLLVPLVACERKQPVAQAKKEIKAPSVVLEKVWEVKVSEDVKDMILGEIEVSMEEAKSMGVQSIGKLSDDGENVKLIVPKVIMKDDGIYLLDEKGMEVKKFDIIEQDYGKQSFSFEKSNNSKYIGVQEILEYGDKGPARGRFKMFDLEGNLLWKTDRLLQLYIPSKDGRYVVGRPDAEYEGESMPLNIFDANGLKGEIRVPSYGDGEINYSLMMSKDGERIVVADEFVSKVYDRTGRKLWQKEDMYVMAVSNDYLVLSRRNEEDDQYYIHLYNSKYELLWKREKPKGAREFMFSEDGRLLYFCCGLLEVNTGALLWQKNLVKRGTHHRRTATTPDMDFILVEVGILYLFNSEGNILWTNNDALLTGINRRGKHLFDISKDGKLIVVETGEGLQYFYNHFAAD